MARISYNMIAGLRALSVVADRNTAEGRKVIGWNYLNDTLWAYSDLTDTIALLKLHDTKDIQLLPERGAFIKPAPKILYTSSLDVLDIETLANPNAFYELFDLGERLERWEAEEDTLLSSAYSKHLWEATEGRIRMKVIRPFGFWSFKYVDIHERGVRLLTPDVNQVLIKYRTVEYKKIPRKKFEHDLSEVLVKI